MGKFLRHFKGLSPIGNVRVRILRGQPTSPAFRELAPYIDRKARHWRAFAIRRPVSVLPISPNEGRIRGKSLADAANIPDSGRVWPETEVDRHCLVMNSADFAH